MALQQDSANAFTNIQQHHEQQQQQQQQQHGYGYRDMNNNNSSEEEDEEDAEDEEGEQIVIVEDDAEEENEEEEEEDDDVDVDDEEDTEVEEMQQTTNAFITAITTTTTTTTTTPAAATAATTTTARYVLPLQSSSRVRVNEKQVGQRDDWAEDATYALLQAWSHKCVQLNRCNLKQEHWLQVASSVATNTNTNKTDVQCKNRIDTLKKKYKHEKQKIVSGSPSKWIYFKLLDTILKSTPKRAGIVATTPQQPVTAAVTVPATTEKRPRFDEGDGDGDGDSDDGGDDDVDDDEDDDLDDDVYERSCRKRRRWSSSSSYKIVAKAIVKFGEIFERMESAKQQQIMDLERIRMQYTRDLEMQRMELLMQTQVELSQVGRGKADASSWMLAPLLFGACFD